MSSSTAGPVFATKWDFLFAWVLLGVDRSTGVWSGTQSAQGQDMVCVWTSDEVATEALHVESWDLKQIKVRDLLAMLPDGVGIIIDPERQSGMTTQPSYVANLKKYVVAFPPDSQVRLSAWELPSDVGGALAQAANGTDHLRALHAFTYTVDDSPLLGCLAYVAELGCDTVALTRSLEAAIESRTTPAALGLPTVNMLALADVPDAVRDALGDAHVLHRRRRSGFWRR